MKIDYTNYNPLSIATYTERSLACLQKAEIHAKNHGWKDYGTECLLLAISEEGDTPSANALREHGVTPDLLKVELQNIQPYMNRKVKQIRPTNNALSVLTKAATEAKYWKHPAVSPEHILLGILSSGEGIGLRLLTVLGIDLPMLKGSVIKRFRSMLEAPPRLVVTDETPTLAEVIRKSTDDIKDIKESLVALREDVNAITEIFRSWGCMELK